MLVELDGGSWKSQLDRAETFLGNVVPLQPHFRTLTVDVLGKVAQPRFHALLRRVAADARRQERRIDDFHRMLGRVPRRRGRALAGSLGATGSALLGEVEGLAGGTSGPWPDLRQRWGQPRRRGRLRRGRAAQPGAPPAGPRRARAPPRRQKHRDTLLIQQIVPEMAAVAVLCDGPTGTSFGPRTSAAGRSCRITRVVPGRR